MTVKTIEDWKECAEEWEQLAYHYQDERDALAAHVERLQEYGRRMMDSMDQKEAFAVRREFEAALTADPATSLARLKAQWQADLLRGLLLNHSEFLHPEAGAIAELMNGLEKALRRQAEEGTS